MYTAVDIYNHALFDAKIKGATVLQTFDIHLIYCLQKASRFSEFHAQSD